MEEYIKTFFSKKESISHHDIDDFVIAFIDNHSLNINSLCKKTFGDTSNLSISAFKEMITSELKKACVSFINNKYPHQNIKAYLISCMVNVSKSASGENKSLVFICPGCKFFDKIQIAEARSKNLYCLLCSQALMSATEDWEKKFYKCFSSHSRKGYRCNDCERFIPSSEQNNDSVSCPYNDCMFFGNVSSLKSMRHPSIKTNLEILSLDRDIPTNDGSKSFSLKDSIDQSGTLSKTQYVEVSEMEINEDINKKISILFEVIDSQINVLHYKSSSFTLKNKLLMYESFKIIIKKFPEEMVSYLIYLNKVGFQHKIFQQFISLLEKEIPFSFSKGGKTYEVKSLLDENLYIFDGISNFETTINENFEALNKTEELYVGGRKATYCKPYYIGKLLDVRDDLGNSLLHKVKEYNFYKIIFHNDIVPNTKIKVKHLRIAPHYQMGALVYLNRIRTNIVDKAYFILYGKKRKPRKYQEIDE